MFGGVRFQPTKQPQRLAVALKPATGCHQTVQRDLSGMTKRRVPQIVGESDGFDQLKTRKQRLLLRMLLPQPQHQPPPDLGDLHRVGEAGAVEIVLVNTVDLGFCLQPPERGGMDDAGAVPLKGGTGVVRTMWGVRATPCLPRIHPGQWREVCQKKLRNSMSSSTF